MKNEDIKKILDKYRSIEPESLFLKLKKEDIDLLNNIQNDLFDKLNDFKIVFLQDSDQILKDYIICYELLDRKMSINDFIKIYISIYKVYK